MEQGREGGRLCLLRLLLVFHMENGRFIALVGQFGSTDDIYYYCEYSEN